MMSEAMFKHLTAIVAGSMVGSFVGALVVGCILAALTNKGRTGEDFKKHRNSVIFAVYWWWLCISILYQYMMDFTLLCIAVVASLIVYGVYRVIKKPHVGTKATIADAEISRDNDDDSDDGRDELSDSQPELVQNTKQLDESEEYWSLVSYVYSKIKQTSIFKLWRREQFDCQFGKCAICGKPMDAKFSQVDHIRPRYRKGTNYSNNLALTHKKCNELKSAKTGYTRPDWIKPNKFSKQLDDKVYEITEQIRQEYPVKLPDEMFEKPDEAE